MSSTLHLQTSADFDTLARTIWGEARGEHFTGQRAVAHVIMNRASDPQKRWPRTWRQVCRQPWQFSCWNSADPNRLKLANLDFTDRSFVTAYNAALNAVDAERAGDYDPTKGANHYHTKAVQPYWSKGQTPVATIGAHLFFKL